MHDRPDGEATEHLRALIPQLRRHPGFPRGADEAILGASMPPAYTPCPNPFVEQFAQPDGRQECFERSPFAADIREGRSSLVYRGHIYHTKVPPAAIARYIEHFAPPGGTVFDGFCGSGMTGVAARMTGRRAILVDLSPAATAIAASYCLPAAAKEAADAFDEVLGKLRQACGWLYEVGDGRETDYVIHSEVYGCHQCGAEHPFSQMGFDLAARRPADNIQCPTCGTELSPRRLERALTDDGKTRELPVLVGYVGHRGGREPGAVDMALLDEIRKRQIPYWYPDAWMMHQAPDEDGWGDMWRRGYHRGVWKVADFYTKRTLWCLAGALQFARELDAAPEVRHLVQHTIINTSINLTKMRRAFQGPVPLVLYFPRLRRECNVIQTLQRRVKKALRVLQELPTGGDAIVSTQSSTELANVPDDCVDYIFTDPPFGQNIIYSEVNFLWESWMGITTAQESEAIISKRQHKDTGDYGELMRQCFSEFGRVLKPGRWMTVQFHNSKNEVWTAIQQALEQAGLAVQDVRILHKQQPSFKQASTENAVDQDLVISACKPPAGHRPPAPPQDDGEQIWRFVQARLRQLSSAPRSERVLEGTDRALYSRMVQHFLTRGWRVPIDAQQFYAELPKRFAHQGGIYQLSEDSGS